MELRDFALPEKLGIQDSAYMPFFSLKITICIVI